MFSLLNWTPGALFITWASEVYLLNLLENSLANSFVSHIFVQRIETFNVLKLLFLHDIIQLSPKGRKTVMDIKLNVCTKMQSIKVYI